MQSEGACKILQQIARWLWKLLSWPATIPPLREFNADGRRRINISQRAACISEKS